MPLNQKSKKTEGGESPSGLYIKPLLRVLLACAASASAVDVLAGLAARPECFTRYASLSKCLQVWACLYVLAIVLSMIPWAFTVRNRPASARVLRFLAAAVLGADAAFITARLFGLLPLGGLLDGQTPFTTGLHAVFALSTGFAIAWAVLWRTRRFQFNSWCKLASALEGLSILLLEIMAFAWLFGAAPAARWSHNPVSIAVCALMLAGTAWFYIRYGIRLHVILANGVFVCFVAFGATAPLLPSQAGALPPITSSTAPGAPNVFLITIDALRPDALSCYGGANPTPNLDAFAQDCTLFQNAISAAPWTAPSLCSILTGISPFAHRITYNSPPLPESFDTIAEAFYRTGYHTAAFGNNPFLLPYTNINQGFAEYQWFPRDVFGQPTCGMAAWRLLQKEKTIASADAADLVRMGMQHFGHKREKPLFAWFHILDPHIPYAPPTGYGPEGEPPPYLGFSFDEIDVVRAGRSSQSIVQRAWLRTLYNGEVRYTDAQLGLFFAFLKQHGLYDNSLIIVSSDHGEEFWDHGGFEHGHSVHREVVRVPLLIKMPGNAGKGNKVDIPVSTEGLKATFLDLCGIAYDATSVDTPSFAALLGPDAAKYAPAPITSSMLLYYEDRESVRFDHFMYTHYIDSNREEFYDTAKDPFENRNLVFDAPLEMEKGRELLEEARRNGLARRQSLGMPAENDDSVALDPATKERLRNLGYYQ